jgi:hypothetical protein
MLVFWAVTMLVFWAVTMLVFWAVTMLVFWAVTPYGLVKTQAEKFTFNLNFA